MVRAKYVVFAFIVVMMGYVLYHNERFLVQPDDPAWEHYGALGGWLLFHGVAGGAALLLAPLQFSDRLRRKYTKLHRVTGRVYVAGVFVLAPFGAYIQYLDETLAGLPRSFTVASAVDAVLLLATTAIALMFAIKRRIPQHRKWMTRSYAVALVFFEVRFILGVTGWEALGPAVTETVVWTCLAFAVLIGDFANEWIELRTAVTAPVRVPATPREALPDVEPA